MRTLDTAEVLELDRTSFMQSVHAQQNVGAFFRELFLARYHRAPRELLEAIDAASALMPGLRPSRAGLVLGVFISGLALLALTSVASIWTNLAFSLVTLFLGAVLPAACYVAYIRQRDLLRQVPVRTLLVIGLAVAGVAVPLAVYLENLADLPRIEGALLTAVIEEPLKLLGVAWVMGRRQYRFALDGMIFGVTAAVGFGAFESFGYGLLALVEPAGLCGPGTAGPACMVPSPPPRSTASAAACRFPESAEPRIHSQQAQLLPLLTWDVCATVHIAWTTAYPFDGALNRNRCR